MFDLQRPRLGGEPGRHIRRGVATSDLDAVTQDLACRDGVETAVLAVWEEHDGWLIDVLSVAGLKPGSVVRSETRSGDFLAWVCESARADTRALVSTQDGSLGVALSGAPLTHAIGVPFVVPGGPVGALCAGLSRPPEDTEATFWVLDSLARTAALCLHDAARDPAAVRAPDAGGLPRLLRRRTLRHELQQVVGRADREGLAVSCCLVKITGLDLADDLVAGDDAPGRLAGVVAVVEAAARGSDHVAAHGPDGVVILATGAHGATTHPCCDRVRKAIERDACDFLPAAAEVFVVAVEREGRESGSELLARTEQALALHGGARAPDPRPVVLAFRARGEA